MQSNSGYAWCRTAPVARQPKTQPYSHLSPTWFAVASAILGSLGTLMVPTQNAWAACAPANGSNITVTCSGTTVNQGPGVLTGYGDSTQNGLTINVQSGASVTGTNTGIDVNNNNIINNFGTVTTSGGDLYAISGNGSLTVNNSGSIGNTNEFPGVNSFGVGLTVNNNAGAVIYGQSAAIQGAGILGVGTTTVVNSGLINGQFTGIDGGSGFLDITNMLSKYSSATEPVADPSAALTLNTLSSLTLRRRQTKFSGSGSNVWTRSNSALRRLA
jgi:hypothetical protein